MEAAIDFNTFRKNLFGISNNPTKNVCRSLFGEVDHEEIKRDLEREFKETLQQKSELWNFNFVKFCPRDTDENNKDRLQWKREIAPASNYTTKIGQSLVTAFHNSPLLNKKNSTTELSLRTSPRASDSNKQTFITDFTEKVKTKTSTSTSAITTTSEDERNVIEIVNESPTRNITRLHGKSTTENYRAATKLQISDHEEEDPSSTVVRCAGKRKRRNFQPTIDDFMKKKKPRVNTELNLRKPSKVNLPISSRLRSSPAVKVSLYFKNHQVSK